MTDMQGDVFVPTVFYRDPKAALAWLEQAFGFETALLVTDDAGNVGHAEMSYRGCNIGVAGEWTGPQLGGAELKSPASIGGVGTQFSWVNLADSLDEHSARAAAAGARITQLPEDQFYGARTYRALDLEGHIWCFRMTVSSPSMAEMAKSSGLKFSDAVPA